MKVEKRAKQYCKSKNAISIERELSIYSFGRSSKNRKNRSAYFIYMRVTHQRERIYIEILSRERRGASNE